MEIQKESSQTTDESYDLWENKRTGEVFKANNVMKKVNRNGFEITYLINFFELFDKLGGQKYQVAKYILKHRSKSENTLIITTQELAKKTKVSRQTVSDTLKIMEEAKLISRKRGAIMVSAKLIHRGTSGKEFYLMEKFESFNGE